MFILYIYVWALYIFSQSLIHINVRTAGWILVLMMTNSEMCEGSDVLRGIWGVIIVHILRGILGIPRHRRTEWEPLVRSRAKRVPPIGLWFIMWVYRVLIVRNQVRILYFFISMVGVVTERNVEMCAITRDLMVSWLWRCEEWGRISTPHGTVSDPRNHQEATVQRVTSIRLRICATTTVIRTVVRVGGQHVEILSLR